MALTFFRNKFILSPSIIRLDRHANCESQNINFFDVGGVDYKGYDITDDELFVVNQSGFIEACFVGPGGPGGSSTISGAACGGGGGGEIIYITLFLQAGTYQITIPQGGIGRIGEIGLIADPLEAFGVIARPGSPGGSPSNPSANIDGVTGGGGFAAPGQLGPNGETIDSLAGKRGGAANQSSSDSARSGGGGGGFYDRGQDGTSSVGGRGGHGERLAFLGTAVWSGVGGRGGRGNAGLTPGSDGEPNTGNGGEGASNGKGGDGGSARIMLRHPI